MQTLLWKQTRLMWETLAWTVTPDSYFAFSTTHFFFLIKRSLTQVKTTAVSGRDKQFVFRLQQKKSIDNTFFLHTSAND